MQNTKLKDENGYTPFDYLSDEVKYIVNLTPAEYAEFRKSIESTPEVYSSFCPNAIQYEAHTKFLESSNVAKESCNDFKNIINTTPRILPSAIFNKSENDREIIFKTVFILSQINSPRILHNFSLSQLG